VEGHASDARVRPAAAGPRHAASSSGARSRGAAARGFAATAGPAHRLVRPRISGADGNERLTAITGAVLLVLLAAEGVTIVFLRPLLPVHFFVGMLAAGPVLLKSGSVLYRFARYYTGSPQYREKGPPAPLPRIAGPFVLLSSLGVIGTGAGLAVAGPGAGELLLAHKASFVIWFLVMTVHVLTYIWRVPGLAAADWRYRPGSHAAARPWRDGAGAPPQPAGRAARWTAVAVALASGLAVATATLHLAVPWQHLAH